MPKYAVLLTLAGVLCSAPALAADTAAVEKLQQQVRLLDQDGDNRLSREEMAGLPYAGEHFDAVDRDRNGQITVEEMAAARDSVNGRMKAEYADLDRDGDGRISRAEAEVRPKLVRYFDRLDRDRDGWLTKDELRALRKALLKEHLGG